MFFALGVYVKNIEKYKGIYAISKIYLGLLSLADAIAYATAYGKATRDTKNKKRSPGQVRSKK